MPLVNEGQSRPCILHELPRRIRVRNPVFHDPAFDPVYMEAVLGNIPGVARVRFNIRTASVVVEYDGNPEVRRHMLDCVSAVSVDCFNHEQNKDAPPDPVGTGAKALWALMTPAMPRPLRAALSLGLALPVLMEGLETLLAQGIKVPVLDATAVGLSLWRRDFMTANSILALLGLGEYLEKVSEEKATGLLKKLLRPQVEFVWVERSGQEIRMELDQVVIGDRVVCGSGEMIPVDGTAVEGEAEVNQSSITGESVPVHVAPGDEVLSGAVIEEGRLIIEARRVGRDTSMARINRFLENSLRNKSKAQKKSDELAERLVPATFALGLGQFLLTRNVRRAASVLTVDYSCAIKLAYPVTVRSSMFTAAKGGVLLKGAQAMDALAGVDTMVFDKTGTLTRGVLEVTDVIPLKKMTPDGLLALAAAAEEHYAHPVAKAVVGEAAERGLKLPKAGQVDFIVAHGVSAFVKGRRVLVGSRHFIADDEGIDCRAADDRAQSLRREGKSLLYVAREGTLEGLVALRDALRPEAAGVLKELKTLGIKQLVMLTGDHPETARAVAGQLEALDQVHWDLKPEDKAVLVKMIQDQGHVVAFAGDGVNDAPALVTAEVGICMPGGADLAREAAQVVLLQDDLTALVTARKIASRNEGILKNCLGATIGFNTLFLILASSGYLAPVTAAVLHNANTVGILGYAALAGMQKTDATAPVEFR